VYVHGYGAREAQRLQDQANALTDLLHDGTAVGAGERLLEVGCGVGAQTVILATRSPEARIVAVDRSADSLAEARRRLAAAGARNVTFCRTDLFFLPFPERSFDHLFVCFVLEHLTDPGTALRLLVRVLRPGGTMTVIEGDHGSALFHPDSEAARAAISSLVRLQHEAGGNALIGRQLYPLLVAAGLSDVSVTPRMAYVDGSRPELADAMTRRTFTAMVEGVREEAVARGFLDRRSFEEGIAALERAAEPDGVFCYTFFKGVARRH